MRRLAGSGRRHRQLVWVGGGVLVALLASVMPLSHDEAFWLAITRKVEAGARLYDGAIDNKTPPVYLVTYLLDAVPGGFQILRGILVAVLVGGIGFMSSRLALALGSTQGHATTLGGIAAAVVALQTEFVFTVELPALASLLSTLWLIARERTRVAAGVAMLAIAFDPRTLLMLPGLLFFAADRLGWPTARRFLAWTGTLTVAGLALVWLQPDLRYGLVELNLGSRTSAGGWRPTAQVAVALRSLLPLLVVGGLTRPSGRLLRRSPFVWLAAGGLVIGVLSVLPFDHYWAYGVVALVFLPPGREDLHLRNSQILAAGLMTVAILPLAINAVTTGFEQRATTSRYTHAAAVLETQLHGKDTFVSFDIKPYMATYLPNRYALRSPVSGYLVWPTSRTDRYLRELPGLIDGSVAISEDGGLRADRTSVSEEYQQVWRIFQERLGEFPCVVDTDEVILRFRNDRCPRP